MLFEEIKKKIIVKKIIRKTLTHIQKQNKTIEDIHMQMKT